MNFYCHACEQKVNAIDGLCALCNQDFIEALEQDEQHRPAPQIPQEQNVDIIGLSMQMANSVLGSFMQGAPQPDLFQSISHILGSLPEINRVGSFDFSQVFGQIQVPAPPSSSAARPTSQRFIRSLVESSRSATPEESIECPICLDQVNHPQHFLELPNCRHRCE